MLNQWQTWAKKLKAESLTLYLVYKHPKTPWYAKGLIAIVVAYAFSPIDLIPDVIPILGYLDDALLLPLGIMLARSIVAAEIWKECKEEAKSLTERPLNRWMKFVIVFIWFVAIILSVRVFIAFVN